MYQFAYSAIVEDPPSPSHPPHYSKISTAIELYDAASFGAFAGHKRLQLLSDFRSLWLSIADGIVRSGAGREGIERDIAAASQAVLTDIERRRFGGAGDDAFGRRWRPAL